MVKTFCNELKLLCSLGSKKSCASFSLGEGEIKCGK